MTNISELKKIAQNFKVLYVEDNLSIESSMSQYLSKLFSEVVSAHNGEEGLEYYRSQKFDLVITDLSMPKMNGIDMLKVIKTMDDTQAVLITSAHSESEYMFNAIKIGIDGYIIKPFDYEQLNHELYKIISKLKIAQENEQYKTHLQQMINQKTAELSHMIIFQSENYEKTLVSMVEMIEDRDTYTAGHSKRVANYSVMIARAMGYSDEECDKLYQAGILHDIGKIATPDAVLLNPKSLNEIEYKLIQEHVKVGYKLLSNIPMFNELSEIMHAHHERFDGSGYPKGSKGDEIAPLSRVMIVADAFDAMTTNRIYKGRKSTAEAISELISLKSIQFHPEIVDIAVVVLKDVVVDDGINQLPKTELEEERFAYFYKDKLVSVYNQGYLDVVLMENTYEKSFKYMSLFFLKNFSIYNRKNGWNNGNLLLQECAKSLKMFFTNSLIFRVFGDDFVVLSKEKIDIPKFEVAIAKIMQNTEVICEVKELNLEEVKVETLSQVEFI